MGFFGSLSKILGVAGGIAAIPFTGGASATLLPAILGAGAGVAGALSNTKGARTSTQTSTSMPVEPEGYKTLGDMLRARAMERLNSSFDTSGIEAGGISDINSAFDPISRGVNNSLTSRGLGTSPVAGSADATLGAARGSEISRFLNTLPQLRRQYANEDYNAANAFYQARPMGTTQTGTGTAPGSAAGSGIGSAAEMIAFLAGQGLFGGGAKKPNINSTMTL